MECFEQRLDNPTAYFVFYDNFLRAAEGEEKWKASATKATTNERLSSPNNESFAMILLKNNYFAWLLEAKQQYSEGLITDYDCEESVLTANSTLTEHLMGGICVENIGFYTVPTIRSESNQQKESNDEDDDNVVEQYRRAKDGFKRNLQEIRERVRYSLDYKLILDSIKRMEGGSYDNDEKSRKKKMRRIMKGLRHYTGARLGQEKAYRGWSNRTHTDMLEYMRGMKTETTRYDRFEEEYRRVYAMRKAYSKEEAHGDNDESDHEANNQETFDELFEIPEEFR
jgi:hypothetical protein